MKEIRTERLLLRAFQEADYDDLFEFLSQLKDDEFEGYPGISYENCREYLQQRMDSEEFYAVELADSGKVIGNIYCGERDFEAKEVGYIINRNYRRTGYAEEALSAVIRNKAYTESMRNAIHETPPRGSSWKRPVCGGKRISGRTSGSVRTRTARPSGRIPMFMQN